MGHGNGRKRRADVQKRGGGVAGSNSDTPGLDTILSKLLTSAYDNATVVDLRITGSRLSSSSSNCERIQRGTKNQYEDNNFILLIANFKDSDLALATHDFDVIGQTLIFFPSYI